MDVGVIHDYVDLRLPVLNNIVVPNYLREINDVVKSRHMWRKVASAVEASAQIVLGAASVLAFSGGFFDNPLLTYFAACCTTLCMALGKLSTYAESECVERNTILTRLLEKINIGSMPSISSVEPSIDSLSRSSRTASNARAHADQRPQNEEIVIVQDSRTDNALPR
jgi:hypothetical protein